MDFKKVFKILLWPIFLFFEEELRDEDVYRSFTVGFVMGLLVFISLISLGRAPWQLTAAAWIFGLIVIVRLKPKEDKYPRFFGKRSDLGYFGAFFWTYTLGLGVWFALNYFFL